MNTDRYYHYFETPLGRMLLVADTQALKIIDFHDSRYLPPIAVDWVPQDRHPLLRQAQAQIEEYFAGERALFDLPIDAEGTAFQCAVWAAIAAVPAGTTISYRELAARAGYANSIRAAGAATGRNPLAIIIPCHRIVGSDGSLTGYAGGLPRKRALLALEAKWAPAPLLTGPQRQ